MKGKDFLKSKWMEEAKKPDAEKQIRQKFNQWSQRVQNTGILLKARELLNYITSGQISGMDKLVVLAALLYIISPIDLIPDFIPIAGWLDDIGVGTFALSLIMGKLSDADLDKTIDYTDQKNPATFGTNSLFLQRDLYYEGLSYKLDELKSIAVDFDSHDMVSMAESIESMMDLPFFRVMFVGKYNSGKSTLINAFLGKELLPVEAIPTKRPITYILAGKEEKLYSESKQGDITIHASLDNLRDKRNELIMNARRISLFLPTDTLSDDLCFIDTPGLEDPNQDFSDMTIQEAPLADALVMVMDIGYAESKTEYAFLKDLLSNDRDRKVFIVLNKSDTRSANEISKIFDRFRNLMETLNIQENRIFVLSAKKACEKIFSKNEPPNDFMMFKNVLLDFLKKGSKAEKERIVSQQLAKYASSLKDICNAQIDLSKKSAQEKMLILTKLSEEKQKIETMLNKEKQRLEDKVTLIENIFLSNFENFCNTLKTDIRRKLDKLSLDELRSDYGISQYLKMEIRKFIEDEMNKIQKELNEYTKDLISSIQIELNKIDFPLSFERRESFMEKNPDLLIGISIIGIYPFLSFFTFIGVLIGTLLGRSYIESMIKKIYASTAYNKIRKTIEIQLDEQLAKFSENFKIHAHQHFETLKTDAVAKLRESVLETIGPAIVIAESDFSQSDDKTKKALSMLQRIQKII